MNRTYYEKYKSLAFDLAKTLVIKSSASADAVNLLLTLKYGKGAVDIYNKNTWKYYLNLSGQYHSSDLIDIANVNSIIGVNNNKVTIKSLDTLLDITLDDSTTLNAHPNTKLAYTYGSRYYDALIKKYTNQQQLVNGLLYPVNIDTAINAVDGTILVYHPDLIEPQEVTLISDLENWVKSMILRWHIQGFTLTDSLYSVSQHAILYTYLVPAILNLRLARCKTPEVHSFHIRMYLAGHDGLDRFYPYLTHKQALWLYRNLDRIIKYSGHTETFDWLVQNILVARNIPLDGLTIYQQEGFNSLGLSNFTFVRKSVTPTVLSAPVSPIATLEVLNKEDRYLATNMVYHVNNLDKINTEIQDTNVGVRLTKVLDSAMLDTTDETRYTLVDELFNNWVYMASNGLYNPIINFKDPIGSNLITLSAQDAFIYIIFLMNKAFKIGLTTMPDFTIGGIPRTKPFNPNTLYPNNASSNVKTTLNYYYNNHKSLTPQITVLNFYNTISNVFKNKQIYQDIVASQSLSLDRGLIEIGLDRLHFNTTVGFKNPNGSPIVFSTWLNQNNLADVNYSNQQLMDLINVVTVAATGLKNDPFLLPKNIQTAMIGIMKQLSSYSVQYLTSINTTGIKPIRWAAIRLNGTNVVTNGKVGLNVVNIKPISAGVRYRGLIAYDINKPYADYGYNLSILAKGTNVANITLNNLLTALKPNSKFNRSYNLSSGRISITLGYLAYDPLISNTTVMAGYETFLALTPQQQNSILSIY